MGMPIKRRPYVECKHLNKTEYYLPDFTKATKCSNCGKIILVDDAKPKQNGLKYLGDYESSYEPRTLCDTFYATEYDNQEGK